MTEEKFKEETDKLVLQEIDNNILKHTIQFLNRGNKRLKPFGTGVFAKIHNDYFIITASHVADFFENNPNEDLNIRVTKKLFINVLGEIKYTNIDKSQGVDLAYIKLDIQMVEPLLKVYKPITIEKFRSHNNLLYAMNYCVLGFPTANISKESEPFDTGASIYLVNPSKEKPYQYYNYNKRDYIILDMKGKGIDIKTNTMMKFNTEFYGISGCGLWLLIFSSNPLTGKTQLDYRLVGIMTEYKKGKYFCLVANKIYLIIEAFKIIEKYKFKEKIVKFE
jgi:hypothetical protein